MNDRVSRTSVRRLLSLTQEFELRKHARQEGRRYCDPVVLTYQAERMPEQIRLKVSLSFRLLFAIYGATVM